VPLLPPLPLSLLLLLPPPLLLLLLLPPLLLLLLLLLLPLMLSVCGGERAARFFCFYKGPWNPPFFHPSPCSCPPGKLTFPAPKRGGEEGANWHGG
jgi:hypothetical protein